MTPRLPLLVIVAFLSSAAAFAAPPPEYGKVELLRDTWGVPHVFADTDPGALYGLGYAAAESRAFQMYYSLRVIQGRAAELLGPAPIGNRRETAIDHDRKMRTFGFYRAARDVAARLDPETLSMLDAYCRGVNDYITSHPDKLHPLFKKLALNPDPWTPADCIASWWHLGQFFATDGTRDLLQYRNLTEPPPPDRPQPPKPGPRWFDDAAAVVQREDVSDEWLRKVQAFYDTLRGEPSPPATPVEDTPRFSHAWVVGGTKTTTGSAVLVSDPQTPVRFPALWMEWHVAGKTFNARGIGVPGSPMLLVGWNQNVAWGLTALGADQADLFRLQTDDARPDQYFFDGQWRPMTVLREQIKIANAPAQDLTVRLTHLGPVATEFCFARPQDGQVALKRIPVCEPDRDTIQSMLPMLRAADAAAFSQALSHWRFPSANCVFGDRAGNVGYWTLGALPVRPPSALNDGNAAHDGTASRHDWLAYVPHDLLPHALNPSRGHVFSANHRPVGAFYPIPTGASTGSLGDTLRSWRLRERLAARDRFTPEDVLDVHFDTVNPARREIVRAGLHLRDALSAPLSADARRALQHLEPWLQAGASSDLAADGAPLATEINLFFRMMQTPLALEFGGGQSGLARFLKDLQRHITRDPKAPLKPDEIEFIDQVLAGAWRSARERFGDDPRQWKQRALHEVARRTIGAFQSLDGFTSLDPAQDLPAPPLTCVDGDTIKSQAGQSYTQYVPLHDVDAAMSLLPPGHSELPGSAEQRSTYELWARGKLHPAPLSRTAVEKIVRQRQLLSEPR